MRLHLIRTTIIIALFLQSDRSDTLKLTQTGTGGLAELREVLDDSRASFAYVRVQYSNDKVTEGLFMIREQS